jgi:hypothetical protein
VPATNNFSQTDAGIIAPFTRAVPITPSDTEDLAEVTRGLNVHKGTGGSTTTIKVLLQGDTDPVTMTFQVGFVIPLRIRRVYATGTDATVIVGLY